MLGNQSNCKPCGSPPTHKRSQDQEQLLVNPHDMVYSEVTAIVIMIVHCCNDFRMVSTDESESGQEQFLVNRFRMLYSEITLCLCLCLSLCLFIQC